MNRLEEAVVIADVTARQALCAILDCPTTFATREPLLRERLYLFLSARSAAGSGGKMYPYARLCERSAKALKLDVSGDELETEFRVVEYFAARFDASLSENSRRSVSDILTQHERDGHRDLLATFSAGGFLALLKAGGFGTFVSASTLLGAFTTAMNISVPFSAYIGVSQVLSAVIGPAAWLGLAAGAFVSVRRHLDLKFVPLILWTFVVQSRSQVLATTPAPTPAGKSRAE